MTDSHRLILANLPYAGRLATMFCKRHNLEGPVSEDIASAAVHGLCRAADRFDPEHGVKFETYCYTWILGSMFNFVRREMRAGRAIAESGAEAVEAMGFALWPMLNHEGEPVLELSYAEQPGAELRVLARELRRHVDALPAFERVLVVEQYFEGLTQAASARRRGRCKAHVLRTRRKAVERLRGRWDRKPLNTGRPGQPR